MARVKNTYKTARRRIEEEDDTEDTEE